MIKILYRKRFKIICLLLISFIYTFAGCQTSNIYTINAEQIKIKKIDEIYELKLKDSTFVRATDENEIKYYYKINSISNVFVYKYIDSTGLLSNKAQQIENIYRTIPLDKVAKIRIGKDRFDPGTTILLAGGIALLLFLFAGVIAAAGMPSIRF